MQDNTGTLSKKTRCLYRFPTVTTNCWDIRTQACSPIRIGKHESKVGAFPFCWIHIKTRFSVSHRRMSWSVPPQRIGVYHLQDVNGPNGPPMSRPGSGFTVPSVHPPGSGTGIQTTCHSLRSNFVTDVHLAWLAEERPVWPTKNWIYWIDPEQLHLSQNGYGTWNVEKYETLFYYVLLGVNSPKTQQVLAGFLVGLGIPFPTNPKLVGGFTPFEEYDRQVESFPHVRVRIQKHIWNHQLARIFFNKAKDLSHKLPSLRPTTSPPKHSVGSF